MEEKCMICGVGDCGGVELAQGKRRNELALER